MQITPRLRPPRIDSLSLSARFSDRREWDAARDLQERLLPCHTVRSGGLEYYAQTERCGKLGGDFFGFVPQLDGQLVAVIGNVSPAGAPAGIVATALQSALRVLLERERELTAIMHALNQIAWDLSPDNVLGTLLCLRMDPVHHRVEYVSAGQDLAFILPGNSRHSLRLEATGAVLGLSRQSSYISRSALFQKGEVLVALTQGAARDFEELPELVRLVSESRHAIVRDPAAYILNSTEFLAGGELPSNDRTAAVIRFSNRGDCGTPSACEKAGVCLARSIAA